MIQSLDRFRAWCKRIRYSKDVKAAMDVYRKMHPYCEWDFCSNNVHVHHIIPVHIDPSLAADPSNMVSLGAKRCHLAIGHAGNWRTRYVRNVLEVISNRKITFTIKHHSERPSTERTRETGMEETEGASK